MGNFDRFDPLCSQVCTGGHLGWIKSIKVTRLYQTNLTINRCTSYHVLSRLHFQDNWLWRGTLNASSQTITSRSIAVNLNCKLAPLNQAQIDPRGTCAFAPQGQCTCMIVCRIYVLESVTINPNYTELYCSNMINMP